MRIDGPVEDRRLVVPRRPPKSADLGDVAILTAIARHAERRILGARLCDLESEFLHFPAKLVRAKLSKLIRRRLVTGCACGCRGDFGVALAPRPGAPRPAPDDDEGGEWTPGGNQRFGL